MDWMIAFGKLAPGVAALGAALVARSGLNTWRRQLRGQAEYELARRVLRALLRVRDEIGVVRSPVISGGEFWAAFKEAGLEAPEGSVSAGTKGSELVYDRRWRRLVTAVTELEAELLEAEVLWGAGSRAPEAELRKCVAELFAAVSMHARMLSSPSPSSSLTSVVDGQFRTLYRVHSDADPDIFGQRVDKTVTAFEGLLRPHLLRTG